MSNEKEVYEKLATLEERSNHIIGKIDNIRDNTSKIFERLDKLPCGIHEEKIKGQGKSLDRAWVWIYGIVIGFILTGAGFLIIRSVLAQ